MKQPHFDVCRIPGQSSIPDNETRRKCLALVMETAEKYHVPAPYITAHVVEPPAVNEARKEVQRRMLTELRLTRGQIALAFGRDRRRIRASVIGV